MSTIELINDLKSGNDKQRRAASYKLSKLLDASTVPDLIASFNDKDPSVRQNVISALSAIGNKDAIDFLEANGIKSSSTSKRSISIPQQLRTKGKWLSIIAAISIVFVGGFLMIFLFSDADPELSGTEKILLYGMMVAGYGGFYFVRKYYNDKADEVERTQEDTE